jgi:diaminopropionate ammonia-lyase
MTQFKIPEIFGLILFDMSATGYLLNKRSTYTLLLHQQVQSILDDFSSSIKYHSKFDEYAVTPLLSLPTLASKLGVNNIFVKDESQRFGTNALKILGATYAVNHFSDNENIIGICTATDGNHGRAVAWAARNGGYKSVVFVPDYTSESRIKAIENEGAKVIVSTGNYDHTVKEAAYFAKEKNFKLIQDTSWKEYMDVPACITAGYYTQMQELMGQTNKFSNPKVDIVFVQAGVGSWPSAVTHFFRKNLNNQSVKIVCVEPYESDCIYESVKNDSLATTKKSQKTIMAGLNCGTPSILAMEILKQGADAFMLISDQYTIDAIKYLNAPMPGDPYIASGESGAAGLAGLLALMTSKQLTNLRKNLNTGKDSNILVFNTEGVTDPNLTHSLLE